MRDQLMAWQARLAPVDWVPWMIIGFAALLRFFLLGIKPPHFDEGINGWFVDQMIRSGFYKYDPTNYHGPLHFYVLFLSQTLFGRNVWALRLPVVLVSALCVWLTFKFEPFVGRTAARLTALAMAVSPGFVFYGRYSIHEVWLQLFSMMFVLGLLGLWKFGTARYLWCVGMGIAGMILTKETYIIHIGCAIIAAGVCYVTNWLSPMPDIRPAKQTWSIVDLVLVCAVGIALIVFFYSGTFFYWNGVKDIFKAYAAWFQTGHEGHGHEKPFYYWVKLLAPSFQFPRADFLGYELPALAGLILCVFCLRFKNISFRYLAIYGVGTLMAYSIVHYKTPWCIISIIWPFLFLFGAAASFVPLRLKLAEYAVIGGLLLIPAGAAVFCAIMWDIGYAWSLSLIVGVIVLLIALRNRQAMIGLAVIVLCLSLVSTIWLNYFRCTTESEPYVYVQTYNDIFKLTKPVLELARQDPVFYMMVGHIIRESAYPLPWILDDFPNIGYYEHDNLPAKIDADFLLVQEAKVGGIEAKLHDSYYTDWMTIRSYQDPSKLYLNAKMFKGFFPDRAPDFVGHGQQP
ncbi:MAG: hypothetical protein QOE73_87 [Verrucomicrobiota bacterium]